MKLRIIFVAAVCLSCLLPPAEMSLLKLGAAVKGALIAKGLAVGAAAKGAALLAKGAVVKGAALLAGKGVAAHHALVYRPAIRSVVVPPVFVHKTVAVSAPIVHPYKGGLWSLLQNAIRAKTAVVSTVVHAAHNKVARAPTVVVSKAYPVPY